MGIGSPAADGEPKWGPRKTLQAAVLVSTYNGILTLAHLQAASVSEDAQGVECQMKPLRFVPVNARVSAADVFLESVRNKNACEASGS
jgi:hypothetical protein